MKSIVGCRLQIMFYVLALLLASIAPRVAALPARSVPASKLHINDDAGQRNSHHQQHHHQPPAVVKPMVIGGEPTGPCRWPWMAALMTYDRQFVCGATVISSQWLITAAHCVYNAPVDLYAAIGAYNLTEQDEVVYVKISNIVVHPNYDPSTYGYNDLALLELVSPVDLNATECVEAIHLPAPDYDAVSNPDCAIIGWGKTGYDDEGISDVLTEKRATVITNELCQLRWQKSVFGTPTIYTENVCIDEKHNVSACQGDSGGPLQCYVDGRGWTIVGVASWGSSACRWYPSVYMNVSDFNAWIASQMLLGSRTNGERQVMSASR